MQTIVSAKEMRWCDQTTIRKHRIPGLTLMEQAGRGVADIALHQFGSLAGKDILVFCGKGNNGGDGFVVARHLLRSGAHLTVILLAPSKQLKGDTRTNFQALERLRASDPDALIIKPFSRGILSKLRKPFLIIDAIFGTGFTGSVRQPLLFVIKWINGQNVPVLSVDIPSGVDGTTGAIGNVAVKASRTATFGLLKSGLLCNQGQDQVGEISIVDIGIPDAVSRSKNLRTFVVEENDVRVAFPHRASTANKYSVGKVFILAGSKGYTGAAYLCAMSALRAGAGAVMLGIPEAVYSIVARRLAEAIVKPLLSTSEGTLAAGSMKGIEQNLEWADTLLIGPGLSMNAETQEIISTVLRGYSGKVVVDADALRAIGGFGLAKLKRLKGEFILTPHAGEYSRLVEHTAKEIERDRIEMARNGASLSKSTIVLKGGPTATGAADGSVFLNSTGNPGMATVGSGDVLAGIIASFWAQGMTAIAAAYSGVYCHGLSGDIAKQLYGERSIIAQDLIEQLSPAIKRVESV